MHQLNGHCASILWENSSFLVVIKTLLGLVGDLRTTCINLAGHSIHLLTDFGWWTWFWLGKGTDDDSQEEEEDENGDDEDVHFIALCSSVICGEKFDQSTQLSSESCLFELAVKWRIDSKLKFFNSLLVFAILLSSMSWMIEWSILFLIFEEMNDIF